MKGNVKHKVVSSGRLTGGGRVQPIRRRVTGGHTSKTVLCTDPAYSLYSTDSEDQVAFINKGLDGCTALLNGILQAERAEVQSSLSRPVKSVSVKPRTVSSSVKRRDTDSKKTSNKQPKKTVPPPPVQKSFPPSRSSPVLTASSRSPPTADPRSASTAGLQTAARAVDHSTDPRPASTAARAEDHSTDPRPASKAGAPFDPAWRTELQSAASESGPGVLFNCRLTSSTPTLSLEKPASSTPASMDSPGHPAQRQASVAGARRAGQVQALDGACVPPPAPLSSPVVVSRPADGPAGPGIPSRPGTGGTGAEGSRPGRVQDWEPWSGDGRGGRGGPCGGEEEEDRVAQRDVHGVHRGSAGSRGWEDTQRSEVKVKTIQCLLEELKTVISGQGGVAESLLCDLEHTLSSLPAMVDSRNVQAEIELQLQPLRSHNAQLRRRVRILNQQLQERERAERESRETQCDSEASALQAELSHAHTQLQEVEGEAAALQKALQDTKSRLRDREEENARIHTELQITSSRLLEIQTQRSELALMTQQRREDMHTVHRLNRTLRSVSCDPPAVTTDGSAARPPLTKRALDQYERAQPLRLDPVGQYLSSLGGSGSAGTSPPSKGPRSLSDAHLELRGSESHISGESVFGPWEDECVGGGVTHEDKENTTEAKSSTFAPPMATATTEAPPQSLDNVLRLLHQSRSVAGPRLDQSHERLDTGRGLASPGSSPWPCGVRSVSSDWSVCSGSTFNSRDEVEFQNGLAALDASIASLQRTIKMDLQGK